MKSGFIFVLLMALTVPHECFAAKVSWKKKAIYFGIATETTLPFLEIKNTHSKPEIVRGILKDFAEALFAELKLKPILVLLPQKRVASDLTSGDLSLVCYAHETWIPNARDELLWSDEIAVNTNSIVGLAKTGRPTSIQSIYGKQVGAIVNFAYQTLDPYFEKGLIHRENAPNSESNLQKLLHGRVDYILLSNLEFDYYKKTYPQLIADDLHLDTVPVKCAISKKSGIDIHEINKAIQALKKNGTLKKIFTP